MRVPRISAACRARSRNPATPPLSSGSSPLEVASTDKAVVTVSTSLPTALASAAAVPASRSSKARR
jgi:hypothetical protein